MPKFWSDDFDMDLLKLFPNLPEMLGAMAEMTMWTVGHGSFGRLNHPTVWNTHGAYLWLAKPNLPRNEHGWYRVNGCVSDSPEIECTWLEWLRDWWSHHYGFIVKPSGDYFPPMPVERFDTIMYDLRGWIKINEESRNRELEMVWLSLRNMTHRMSRLIERHRLRSGKQSPYFDRGTLPGINAPEVERI